VCRSLSIWAGPGTPTDQACGPKVVRACQGAAAPRRAIAKRCATTPPNCFSDHDRWLGCSRRAGRKEVAECSPTCCRAGCRRRSGPAAAVSVRGAHGLLGTDDPAEAAAALGLPNGEPAELRPSCRRACEPRTRSGRLTFRRGWSDSLCGSSPCRPSPGLAGLQRPGDSVVSLERGRQARAGVCGRRHLVPTTEGGRARERCRPLRLANRGRRAAGQARCCAAARRACAAAGRDDETVWAGIELLTAFCDAVADCCARTAGPGTGATVLLRSRSTAMPTRDVPGWPALTGANPMVELSDDTLLDDLATWAAPLVRSGAAPSLSWAYAAHASGGGGRQGSPIALATGLPPVRADDRA